MLRKKIIEFILYNFHDKPHILGNDETINKLIKERASMSRFGDGELFLMTSRRQFKFQKFNKNLSERLLEVLKSDQEGLIIGIPKIFDKNDLKFRTSESKKWWKNYLINNRSVWYKYLDFNKIYGSSTFTRNYIAVKDKSICKSYFENLKKIWEDRQVLIIEGEYSRLGVGNDLFDGAKSLKRILAPSENAFDKYEEILKEAKKVNKKTLILIALGPTATILAYDLHKLGYQAIDIGHIDIEYEWFLKGVTKKIKVKNKYTYEVDGIIEEDNLKDSKYQSEIITKIL